MNFIFVSTSLSRFWFGLCSRLTFKGGKNGRTPGEGGMGRWRKLAAWPFLLVFFVFPLEKNPYKNLHGTLARV